MIPFSRHNISQRDIISVVKVLKSNYLTKGDQVPKFEKKLSQITKSKHVIACNSATSALHLACMALGLKKNDLLDLNFSNLTQEEFWKMLYYKMKF